jgi:hypothetical protein
MKRRIFFLQQEKKLREKIFARVFPKFVIVFVNFLSRYSLTVMNLTWKFSVFSPLSLMSFFRKKRQRADLLAKKRKKVKSNFSDLFALSTIQSRKSFRARRVILTIFSYLMLKSLWKQSGRAKKILKWFKRQSIRVHDNIDLEKSRFGEMREQSVKFVNFYCAWKIF